MPEQPVACDSASGRRPAGSPAQIDGILVLWKPPGITSHDAVAAVRRITGQKRVGHAGTLDPMAEGVLVLGLGEGTRTLDAVAEGDKVYCARIHLGEQTTTDDVEGEVIAASSLRGLRKASVVKALRSFVGPQEQLPPRFSAIKQNGVAAYKRARQGEDVVLAPRPVVIHSIRLLNWERPHAVIEVTCSKGTYIRSLARDLGQQLGVGAHLCGLVRMQVGRWTLGEAAPLPLVEDAMRNGYLDSLLHAVDEAYLDRPAVILSRQAAAAICHGMDLPVVGDNEAVECRAFAEDGTFLALLARQGAAWHPSKVFHQISTVFHQISNEEVENR